MDCSADGSSAIHILTSDVKFFVQEPGLLCRAFEPVTIGRKSFASGRPALAALKRCSVEHSITARGMNRSLSPRSGSQ